MDKYQKRYLEHQKRKALSLTSDYGKVVPPHSKKEQEAFLKIVRGRCSQRVFTGDPIPDKTIASIYDIIKLAPSSCDRIGVGYKPITDRHQKEFLSGVLVGGIGWIYRAHIILLLIGDENAYKSPAEKDYMHFLDAGVIIQTAYLACEAMNVGCCFVNPNIREENKAIFKERFLSDSEIFCGALAMGMYHKKHV